MNTSESIEALAPAFVAAQASFTAVSKDATNPFFNSRYADLNSILDMARPILAENQLAIMQLCQPSMDGVLVQTTLMHETGQWISDESLHLPAAKQDPQGYGAALTYARRYALQSFLCLSTEDDDGNAATAAVSKVEAAKAAAALRRSDAR